MNGNPYAAWLIARERQQEILREAEERRRTYPEGAAPRHHTLLVARGLAWVGTKLVALGERLEEPYRDRQSGGLDVAPERR